VTLGNISGFATLVKKEAPHVITHCYLHRHALATKILPTTLKEVLSTAIKVINFIRSRSQNCQIFKIYRSLLAFKRISLDVLVQTRGRSFIFS
jgi:multisubunit Na+/H+ antiporter MnhE subunit